jgi:type I restriction enzyme S subunit
MRTKNVQVELDLADVWGIPVTFVKREDQFLVDGDLLVSSANSWNLVGKCCWVPPLPWRATFGGFISVLRADRGRLDPRYLYHWFSSANVQAIVRSFGQQTTNISNLNVERCLRLEVPLPTLNEQRRIAAVLDQAAALRAKRRAALAHLDTLAQSIFLDMFGDPATNPMGWPVQRLDQVTECLDRLRRPVTEADRKPGTVPYYGANGRQGWIDRALFDEPLVLVAEDGGYFDAPQRGVAYRIDGPAWVNNHAHILRALPDYVDTEFLHRALRHFDFGPYISGTTRAKLTQGQLNGVRLIVPPLSLQRKFAERVKATLLVKNSLTTMSGRLEELCASLQYRSFVGNFVP